MGRYYNGDIEGKFWVGTQSSSDADFFGATGYQPEKLEYSFYRDEHIDSINKGIDECIEKIGTLRERVFDWFEKEEHFYRKQMEEEGIIPSNTDDEWLARLELGIKILKCVEENGECSFEAEL